MAVRVLIQLTVCKLLCGLYLLTHSARAQSPLIDQLKARAAQLDSDSLRLPVYLELINAYRDENLDSALYYIHKSRILAAKKSDARLLASIYLSLGKTYFSKSDFSNGLIALQQAQQISQTYPPDSTLLEIKIRLAMTYRSQGDYQQGLRLALSALQFYERDRNHHFAREVALLYSELGVIYDHMHEYPLALTYHQKRLDFSQKGTPGRELYVAYNNLGTFYMNTGKLALAQRYIQHAETIANYLKNKNLLAASSSNSGDIAYQTHQYTRAIGYHRQTVSLCRQIGKLDEAGSNLAKLAKDYGAIHQYAVALLYVNQGVALLRSAKAVWYLQEALETKSKLLQQVGDYRQALQITQEAYQLKDSLVGIDKQKAISHLQIRYELQQKQQQIKGLQQDLLLQKQVAKTSQLQLSLVLQQQFMYLAGALLLATVQGVGYYAYRKQQKAQHLLLQQKAAISLQAEQLAALNQTKTKLFSLVSHDLRSPVARLKQKLYHMRTEAHPLGNQPLSFSQVESQVDHILHLLTNLLDWSKTQLDGVEPIYQRADLSIIVTGVVAQLSDYMSQKQLVLLNQVPANLLVTGDQQSLESVLRNVLINAIKFTPVGGYIRLSVHHQPDRVSLTIKDTGIGLSPDQLDRLFTKPILHVGTQGELGTGLGLRLCYDLVSAMGGTLEVKSQLQQGTTVTITLPSARDINV